MKQLNRLISRRFKEKSKRFAMIQRSTMILPQDFQHQIFTYQSCSSVTINHFMVPRSTINLVVSYAQRQIPVNCLKEKTSNAFTPTPSTTQVLIWFRTLFITRRSRSGHQASVVISRRLVFSSLL